MDQTPLALLRPRAPHKTTVKVGDNLSQEQRVQLAKVLARHLEAFAIDGRIGETSLVEHEIQLVPGTKPIAERLRRRPTLHQKESSKQIRRMLEKGIIEPSQSPWASAYVLVEKKTGDMRPCIDYRKLNEATVKNAYPLPNVENCLEPLASNRSFTQLDLCSGYWQIKLSDTAKALSAFRT